ncbi:MAG TPA: hypothetical protein VGF14_06895 [Alphaproteobacteria bacterium]
MNTRLTPEQINIKMIKDRDAAIAKATDFSDITDQQEGIRDLYLAASAYANYILEKDPPLEWLKPVQDTVIKLIQSDNVSVVQYVLYDLPNVVNYRPVLRIIPDTDKVTYLSAYRDAVIDVALKTDKSTTEKSTIKNLDDLVLNSSILSLLPEEERLAYVTPALKVYTKVAVSRAKLATDMSEPVRLIASALNNKDVRGLLSDQEELDYVNAGMKTVLETRDAVPEDQKANWDVIVDNLLASRRITGYVSQETLEQAGHSLTFGDVSGDQLSKRLRVAELFLDNHAETIPAVIAELDMKAGQLETQFEELKAAFKTSTITDKGATQQLKAVQADYAEVSYYRQAYMISGPESP